MDKRQIQRLKTRLEIRQQELRVSIEHQVKDARMVEPEPDAVDQANSGLEKESLLQHSKQEQQLLRGVESALGRIRNGSFGQCVSCRNEIDRKRLEAVPWAPYCIQCQEDFER
jgi:DnaK suppressor protein